MNDEFENALAWFRSAPAAWIESGKKNLSAAAEWIWEVVQGDFNDNASTAQVVTGTVISMIPFVDQICDVRDLVANTRRIKEEPAQSWHWLSLILTLIGLFPTLGSFLKGCLKVVFSAVRKSGAISGVTPRLGLAVDASILGINKFINRSEVLTTLRALKIDNPYKYLASEIRLVATKLNTPALLNAFDRAGEVAKSILGLVKIWGGESSAYKAVVAIETIDNIRKSANSQIGKTLKPVQDFLQQLARRLDIEADMAHRAYLNSVNPHEFRKIDEAGEIAAFNRAKPTWVDDTGVLAYEPLLRPPTPKKGWPSVSSHDTFHSMSAITLPPGTKLYRIVDPTSKDNSICWMSETEFKQLRSKDDWRRRFAVWANWNSNGEFVTYTVPDGPGLNVWEGITASQQLKRTDYVLEGGARQIVIDPSHLEKSQVSKRLKTGWAYDDLEIKNDFVGVPVLKNNWK